MSQPLSPLRRPVRTESGRYLGHVVDVTVEPDTQAIVTYHVKPSRLVPDVVSTPLIIHRSQVIELNDRELIVEDAAQKESAAMAASNA
ncbi:MAG: PRC-barrel domain-containing protein [Candidatus Kerfeldbacteria bacterium]|nr:PRC-barrel domain-containing protein [Candidatus Kerfeldbacteria bacterium]